MNGIMDGWIHGSGEENTIDLDLSAWIGVREKWIVDRSDIDASDRIEIDIHQYPYLQQCVRSPPGCRVSISQVAAVWRSVCGITC